MKAQEIRSGDVLEDDGKLVYTVVEDAVIVRPNPATKTTIAEAKVRYRDGGFAYRQWQLDEDVPVTRPGA